jgi:hypothetical protein
LASTSEICSREIPIYRKNPNPAKRAEQRAGELLRETTRSKGTPGPGRGKKGQKAIRQKDRVLQPKTLAEIGITANQSSDWQKLADVPKEKFEKLVVQPAA